MTTSIFQSQNIKYFNLNDKLISVKVKDMYNIYHNVFNFTNQFQVKIMTMNSAVIKQNLNICLLKAIKN